MTDPNVIAMRFADAVTRRTHQLRVREDQNAATLTSGFRLDTKEPGRFRMPTPPASTGVDILADVYMAERVAPSFGICEERAALCGQFVPNEVVAGIEPRLREDVLARLAPACTVESSHGTVLWLLNQRRRRNVLSRIRQDGRLAPLLDADLPPTDIFGQMLRELLRSEADTRLDGRTQIELLNLLSAIEATADIG